MYFFIVLFFSAAEPVVPGAARRDGGSGGNEWEWQVHLRVAAAELLPADLWAGAAGRGARAPLRPPLPPLQGEPPCHRHPWDRM